MWPVDSSEERDWLDDYTLLPTERYALRKLLFEEIERRRHRGQRITLAVIASAEKTVIQNCLVAALYSTPGV